MLRIAILIACIAVQLLGGCVRYETRVEPAPRQGAAIAFDVAIPDAPAALPLYRLEATRVDPQLLPALGLEEPCRVQPTPAPVPGTIDGARHCRPDEKSGEIEVHPEFEPLNGSGKRAQRAFQPQVERAHKLLQQSAVLPKDTSQHEVAQAFVLRHVRASRDPKVPSTPPENVLFYAVARRSIQGLPVDGPGSRAAIVLDNDQAPRGFVRSWKTLGSEAGLAAAPDPGRVRAEIQRQLLALQPHTPVHVQSISLAYYDGNRALLQPVYRFVAEIGADARLGHSEHVIGFVPFSASGEPIPELADESYDRAEGAPPAPGPGEPAPAAVNVGMYIVRHDRKAWSRDARAFWASLSSSDGASRFKKAQLLAAWPYQFTTDKDRYANSVQLALIEAHGARWAFATRSNCCDPVVLGDDRVVPAGFGAGANGQLRDLVLHSCDVVASPDDSVHWAEPWWHVFKGLRSVVGYRTPMYIDDGAGEVFGRNLGANAPLIAAWFSAVTSLNAYHLGASAAFACEGERALGRPAAIAVCGQANASALDPAPNEPEAKCLDMWWIGDAAIERGSAQ